MQPQNVNYCEQYSLKSNKVLDNNFHLSDDMYRSKVSRFDMRVKTLESW